MPLYDYHCTGHGAFSELATLDDAALPAPCPVCRQPARRVIGVPRALARRPELMLAHAVNERSQHEPLSATSAAAAARREPPLGRRGTRAFYTQEGNKLFPSMRPWMIGH